MNKMGKIFANTVSGNELIPRIYIKNPTAQ
jgi:hypothetical protein